MEPVPAFGRAYSIDLSAAGNLRRAIRMASKGSNHVFWDHPGVALVCTPLLRITLPAIEVDTWHPNNSQKQT